MTARKIPNRFPCSGIRVPARILEQWLTRVFEGARLSSRRSRLLARLLTENDCRCVFSHGSLLAIRYWQDFQTGVINPEARPSIVMDRPSQLVIDGDGGLGYFPCYSGMLMAVRRAKKWGSAVAITRNHNHIGAAGIYSRLAVRHGCIGIAMSAQKNKPDPSNNVYHMTQSAPISVGVPTRDEAPFLLDMGTSLFDFDPDRYNECSSAHIKGMGLSLAVQALAGVVAGVYECDDRKREFALADQGGMFVAIGTDEVIGERGVHEAMDRFVSHGESMQPLPGSRETVLPGGLESRWERDSAEHGVPLADEHRSRLECFAKDIGISLDLTGLESSRFNR